jgi:heavy metal sensor kinase
MRSSTRTRLLLWYVGSLGLLILVFSLVLFLNLRWSMERGLDMFLKDAGRDLRGSLAEPHDESLAEIIDEATDEKSAVNLMYVQVATAVLPGDGSFGIVARSRTLGADSLMLTGRARARAAGGMSVFESGRSRLNRPLRVMSFPARDQQKGDYVIQVATPLAGLYSALGRFLAGLLISIPLLLGVLAVLGRFSVNRAFAPVRRVISAAQTITAEDLSLRIPALESHDEIGELVATFNGMIARLERSFEQVKQFASDAAHELKTPLTAIRGEVEVALRKERDRAEYQEVLKSSLEEVAKLERVVEDLLLLARLDAERGKPLFRPVFFDRVVLEGFEESSARAEQNGVKLILKNVDEVVIPGNEVLLKRLVTNLIDNAIKYNRPGGRVIVALERETRLARFTVEDTGVGIPETALPHILDRFYQVDRERSRDTGGTGLGLAIVKKAVDLHSAKLEVQSHEGEGTIFTITLEVEG